MLEALTAGAKGVSSAARRFRLRCLKAVILLLADQPTLDFELAGGADADADASAMLSPEEKRQQVHIPVSMFALNKCRRRRLCFIILPSECLACPQASLTPRQLGLIKTLYNV